MISECLLMRESATIFKAKCVASPRKHCQKWALKFEPQQPQQLPRDIKITPPQGARGNSCNVSRASKLRCRATPSKIAEPIEKAAQSPLKLQKTRRLRREANTQELPCTAQQWIDSRLKGLSGTDFHKAGVVVYTMQKLDKPSGFDCPFYNHGPRHHGLDIPEDEKAQILPVAAILFFCDIRNAAMMQRAKDFCESIDKLESAPPIFLVPHSQNPSMQLALRDFDETYTLISGARDTGFDAVISGEEPQGFSLALAVASELRQQTKRCNFINKEVALRTKMLRRFREVKAANETIVWDFLRDKVAGHTVPPVDPNIGDCKPGAMICGFKLGQILGEGTFGKVFAMNDACQSTPTGKVIKVLPKANMTDYQGLVRLNNQIELQGILTKSWQHPNLVQLHAVYHSQTSVLIQMQDAGPFDLYKRLKQRTAKKEEDRRPLCARKAASALSQCLKAVCHLHMGPKMCHRDIKPENLIVSETEDDIHICLADFDLASVMSEKALCKGMVGSFPFMAPEMVLQKRYGPFQADIWSAGVVCLEILCGVSVIKIALSLPSASDTEMRKKVSQIVFEYFEQADSVRDFLDECMMPELDVLFDSSEPLLSGMLNVDARKRWTANRVVQEL